MQVTAITPAMLRSERSLGGAVVGETTLKHLLDEQVRFRAEPARDGNAPRLVPDTTAARQLERSPGGDALRRVLQGAVDELHRTADASALGGISFTRTPSGFGAAVAVREALAGAWELEAATGPKRQQELVEVIEGTARDIHGAAAFTIGDDYGKEIVFGPRSSSMLLAAGDRSLHRTAAMQTAHRTLVHELQHVTNFAGSSFWQEGIAELLAGHPTIASSYAAASGLPYARSANVDTSIYPAQTTALRSVLQLAGIDSRTREGIDAARTLLLGGPTADVDDPSDDAPGSPIAERVAGAIARVHELDDSARDRVAMLLDVRHDPPTDAVLDQVRSIIAGAG